VLRGEGPCAINARKTHCIQGHPFSAANTYIRPDEGSRQCRACKLIRRQRLPSLVHSAGPVQGGDTGPHATVFSLPPTRGQPRVRPASGCASSASTR
jgi:hypothetical protein